MATAAQEVTPSAHSVTELRSTAASSAKWAVLQVIGATAGRLLFTFALARFLGPQDFGVVAAGMVYVAFAMLLLDQGFGAALVQRRHVDGDDVRSVATLNVTLAVVLTVATIILAPAVADFFNTPELTAVLRVLALGLVVRGLAIVPTMLSRRAFMFRQLAVANVGSVVVGGVAGMTAAAAGAGYWSLVVQSLVGDGLLLVFLFAVQGLPRFGLQLVRLRSMFRFSIALLGANCLMFVGQNADTITIGRALGSTALAYYALVYRIQRFPLQFIGSAINDVALPIFSAPPARAWPTGELVLHGDTFHRVADVADVGPPRGQRRRRDPVPVRTGLARRDRPPPAPVARRTVDGLSVDVPTIADLDGRTGVVFGWSLATVSLLVAAFAITVQWGVNVVAASLGIVTLAARRAAITARFTSHALLLAPLRRRPPSDGHRVCRPRDHMAGRRPCRHGRARSLPAPCSRPR